MTISWKVITRCLPRNNQTLGNPVGHQMFNGFFFALNLAHRLKKCLNNLGSVIGDAIVFVRTTSRCLFGGSLRAVAAAGCVPGLLSRYSTLPAAIKVSDAGLLFNLGAGWGIRSQRTPKQVFYIFGCVGQCSDPGRL